MSSRATPTARSSSRSTDNRERRLSRRDGAEDRAARASAAAPIRRSRDRPAATLSTPALTVGLRGDVLRRSKRPDLALTAKEGGPRDMASLSVLGNERERTSGTSENALSRTCVPLRSRIGSGPGLLVAAGFSGRVQRRNRTNASGGRIGHGRGRRHRRGQRRGDAGARQSHDACIREIASARAALPLRSPWTNSERVSPASDSRLLPPGEAPARRPAHEALVHRPEEASRWRGPRCLLAQRSGSAGHVRELSFSDTPQGDRLLEHDLHPARPRCTPRSARRRRARRPDAYHLRTRRGARHLHLRRRPARRTAPAATRRVSFR